MKHIYLEALGSYLDLGAEALHQLSLSQNQALRHHDQPALEDFANLSDDETTYSSRARKHTSHLDRLLRADLEQLPKTEATVGKPPPSNDASRD